MNFCSIKINLCVDSKISVCLPISFRNFILIKPVQKFQRQGVSNMHTAYQIYINFRHHRIIECSEKAEGFIERISTWNKVCRRLGMLIRINSTLKYEITLT